MTLYEFKKAIKESNSALDQALANKVDFETDPKSSHLMDYKGIQREYYKKNVYQNIEMLEKQSRQIQELAGLDEENARLLENMNSCIKELKIATKPSSIRKLLDDLAHYSEQIREVSNVRLVLRSERIPEDVRSEIVADVQELGKCFNNNCFRSAIILCGRILETALHRKHYEATQNDLLEKSPGIGLGNIIAKLREKGVEMDPGMDNQIHLINQLRIYSVHKKQTAFEPSKTQAHAIILYTLDILDKLFQ
ncbi:DUF4145 domain-containing protein [Candidatus Woesearchaeota archaeon]|nr:DUF4145 domain-containing protein [Candidatus Woesearchaeota archaeon]